MWRRTNLTGKSNYINSFSNWDVINSTNSSFLKPAVPSQSVVDQYVNEIADDYDAAAGLEDKMEVIMGQKYVHLESPWLLWGVSGTEKDQTSKNPLG